MGYLTKFNPANFVKKLSGEEAVLERLDRLTQVEARTTAAEILRAKKVAEGQNSEMVSGNPLVRFVGRQQASSVSDWALEILHQVASDINKLKRQ